MTNDELLQAAITAVQAGDHDRASLLLIQLVKADPASEKGWLWLGLQRSDPAQRADCFRRVLAINPANRVARSQLQQLTGPSAPATTAALTFTPSPPAVKTTPPPPHTLADLSLPSAAGATALPSWRTGFFRSTSRLGRYIAGRTLTLGLMFVVGIYVAVIIVNLGGFIDQIYRANIEDAIMGMSFYDKEREGEERTQYYAEVRRQMEIAYGLDQPFLLRCVKWTAEALSFDWGTSGRFETLYGAKSEANVISAIILQRLPNTLMLAGSANLLLFITGIPLALFLARKQGKWIDRLLGALTPISSIPSWIIGAVLVIVLSYQLNLLQPMSLSYRYVSPSSEDFLSNYLQNMILPALAVFISLFFQSVYTWRSYFLVHSYEDHVEMAKAKGLPASQVQSRYILRPTLPYIITNAALMLISFWQTTLALEYWFNWQGLGKLFVDATQFLDRKILLGILIIFALLLVLTVFLLDIIYALVDPRVRLTGGQNTVQNIPWRVRLGHYLLTSAKPRREREESLAARLKIDRQTFTRAKIPIGDRLSHWWQGWSATRQVFRHLLHYPSAVIGTVIILVMSLASIYIVIAVPPEEAIRLWREERTEKYYTPTLAQPAWVNLFRQEPLPETVLLDTRNGTASKVITEQRDNVTKMTMTFIFDYKSSEFPQDLVIRYFSTYTDKQPFVSIKWTLPDGRTVKLGNYAVPSISTHSSVLYIRDKTATLVGGKGGFAIEVLFAEEDSAPPVALKGKYTLEIEGITFEEGSELDAEAVLLGKVYGWAGTDDQRRDLGVALLWGMPVAFSFGFLGAFLTTFLTVFIAAFSAWFGGWLDSLVQRITEINMILPALPIAIIMYLTVGKSIWVILGAVVLLGIFSNALKSYRAAFIQMKEAPYIEAAKAYGTGNLRIVMRYLMPRIFPVLIPQLIISIPAFVFLEATLAFLRVSDIYLPTWGKTIFEALGAGALDKGYWHWLLEPLVLLMIGGMAFAMVGLALDRVLNDRVKVS